MPPSLDRLLRELSSAQIESAYGATELGPISTGTFGPDGVLRFSPPADHVVSQVVDAAQQPLASGQQGVLRLRTATMVNDYVGASGRGHAFQDGWFYPGDLATFAQDGSFVLIGRTTEVANIDGVKDDPTLVDEAARSVPGVKEAALIIVEGPTGFEAILAVVCDDDETALAALDAARASSYGMRLETVWRVPSLPPSNRTGQGAARRSGRSVEGRALGVQAG
jgi:acyl-coenzyme A synthetase/AMP-(fatty) acid ligase